MTTSPRNPISAARWRWSDAALLALLAVVVRIPSMVAPTQLGYDDGGYGLAAVAMRQGYSPFRQIFSPQGPLFLPLVHVADLIGLQHRNSPRLLAVAAGVAVTLAVYSIGLQTLDRGRAVLAAGITGASGVLLWTTGPLTGDGPGAAFATWAVAVAIAYRAKPSWGRALGVTLLAGCAVATKSLLVGPALVIAWALIASRRRWAHIGLVPIGAFAIVAALAAPWGFENVMNDYVRYHVDKTTDRKPGVNLSKLTHTFLQRDTFLTVLGGVALLSGTVAAIRRRTTRTEIGGEIDHDSDHRVLVGAAWAWAVIAFAVLLLQDPMFRNHLTALVAPAALLVARYRPGWRVVAVVGVVTLPIQASFLQPVLWPYDYHGTTAEIVTQLRALPPRAWAISDEPGVVWRAGLGTDPNYVDASVLRINSSVNAIKITEPRLVRAASRRRVCAVVVTSDERFGSFTGLPAELARLDYVRTVDLGGTRGLYLRRPCRA